MNLQKNLIQDEIPEKSPKLSGIDTPDKWLSDYGDYLFRYAVLQLKDKSIAEDLVQDTFVSAFRAREQFQGKSSVKTWLITILRNKIIDLVRKKQRVTFLSVENFDDDPVIRNNFNGAGIWSKWLNSWGGSPEALIQQSEFMDQFSSCLSKLPENLRNVFVMRNIDELSTEEICEKLDISSNNVWVILYRSRMRLRECLEANWIS
jgi:RNA polymerase sigma-70 factor (ECF subfamily)